MCWCTRALARTREGEQAQRYCSLLPPGARARIRGKSKLQSAARLPNNDANKCLVAPLHPLGSETGTRGPLAYRAYLICEVQGIRDPSCSTLAAWPLIDAGGCHGRVTAHSSTQLTAPTISLIEAICCNVTPSCQADGLLG